ncbi:hypothetical protein BDE36_1070 [Arcticibacter tournemirensis]|nr:hypothetical protein BDE36_1070 [Arcticibacter tournemirensis]
MISCNVESIVAIAGYFYNTNIANSKLKPNQPNLRNPSSDPHDSSKLIQCMRTSYKD